MKKILILSSILLFSCISKAEEETKKVSKTIHANLEKISDNCDSIILTFRINKDKDCNMQAWQEIVKATADLIDLAEESSSAGKQETAEDVNKILNKSHEFLTNCSSLTGDINKIHGDYSIHLNMDETFAKTIFNKEESK